MMMMMTMRHTKNNFWINLKRKLRKRVSEAEKAFYYLILLLEMTLIWFSFSVPVDCKIPRFVQFAKNLKSTKDNDHSKTPGE